MITKTFSASGDFVAYTEAEQWCIQNGYSVGSMQAGSPVGIKKGDCRIAKWRNLSQDEINNLDGIIAGSFRYGPIIVSIKGE